MKNLFLFSTLLLLVFSSCEKEVVTTSNTIENQQIGQEELVEFVFFRIL